MMKRFLSLILAMVMSLSLAAPAFAAKPDDGGSAESPQYAVYEVPFQSYIGCNTYIDVIFTVAYKGGRYVFESVDSVSFTHKDDNDLYWDLISYSSQLSSTVCSLFVSRREMRGDKYTGLSDTATFTIKIENVMGSAREGGPAVLSPVSVVIDETYWFAGEPALILTE